MSSFVFMKLLETNASRYDAGMALLSLGSMERMYRSVADLVPEGSKAIEVGCGTGGTTRHLLQRCRHVTAVDRSPTMLAVARRKLGSAVDEGTLEVRQVNLTALDREFPDESFDCVVACLLLSELSATEEAYALDQFRRLVRPGGTVVVADEVAPADAVRRLAYRARRAPLAAVTYLLTQTSTHHTVDMAAKFEHRDMTVDKVSYLNGGTVQLLQGRKPACSPPSA